jgi:nucleoside-diphosphate-sugar epimerase
MRVFLAGASGVIGRRLIPLLLARGDDVVGMASKPDTAAIVAGLGATAVVCDVLDATALATVISAARPELVMHYVTALPDDPKRIPEFGRLNARIRIEGTANLLRAATAAGAERFVAQSIAWTPFGLPGAANPVEALEEAVLAESGLVIRYGQFYGPDTYDPDGPPATSPRIHLDAAAARTIEVLHAPSGIVTIIEPDTRLPEPA